MGRDLADSKAILVLGPPDVEGVVLPVVAALNRSGGDVAVARVHPGQVAVLRGNQDLNRPHFSVKDDFLCRLQLGNNLPFTNIATCTHVVLLFGDLLAVVADVAAVMIRVHFA